MPEGPKKQSEDPKADLCFPEAGPWTHSVTIILEHIRNTNSQALPMPSCITCPVVCVLESLQKPLKRANWRTSPSSWAVFILSLLLSYPNTSSATTLTLQMLPGSFLPHWENWSNQKRTFTAPTTHQHMLTKVQSDVHAPIWSFHYSGTSSHPLFVPEDIMPPFLLFCPIPLFIYSLPIWKI